MQLFVRSAIRQPLLSFTLHSYGRTHTVSNQAPITRTPLVLVKVRLVHSTCVPCTDLLPIPVSIQSMIDNQDQNWKNHFLPTEYATHEAPAILSVENFIREQLKYEKSNFTKLVSTFSDSSQPPKLKELTGSYRFLQVPEWVAVQPPNPSLDWTIV